MSQERRRLRRVRLRAWLNEYGFKKLDDDEGWLLRTVSVKRQYVGCAGRVSNAINVVYCSFATQAGHALVGARPYLPAEWATDDQRREQAPTARLDDR